MHSITARRGVALTGAALLAAALSAPALAQGAVSVQLNGRTLALTPPPTERAGRVFVPLRGVFQDMGASVVYDNGTINCQGHGRSVQLHIGSQQALIDGRPAMVDVAPFIIGASTYVPLRFVSQALGAEVNWDNTDRVVAISLGNGGGPPPQAYGPNRPPQPPPGQDRQQQPPPPPAQSGITLADLVPGRGARIEARRPTISASFRNGRVDPNSVRISLDGRDVTSNAYISPRGFTYASDSPIPPGPHTVRVVGRQEDGARFEDGWAFRSVSAGDHRRLSIDDLHPGPGDNVSPQFTISGRTAPGATVVVQIGVAREQAANIGQLIGAVFGQNGAASEQNTVTAGPDGRFATQVDTGASPGSVLAVVITATDPQTGESSAPAHYNLHVH